MIHFAVIGTNRISEKFVRAAHLTGKMRLHAVFSRSFDTALTFGQPFGVSLYYTDLKALAEDKTIDVVYIASPNSLHCEQSVMMMQHGKHVICEKPMASHLDEARKMDKVAKQQDVILFEAYRSEHVPNFAQIRKGLEKIGPVRKAFLNYCQYSSRYQAYLDGENPNTFNPAFSNGSMMDIGYYPLAAAVSLFGKPGSVTATGQLLASGVDGEGCVVLGYQQSTVIIQHSKITESVIPSEIQGKYGSMVIDHIADINTVSIHYLDGRTEELTEPQHENGLLYEAEYFAGLVREQQRPDRQNSLLRAELLTEIRRQSGVVYPADRPG